MDTIGIVFPGQGSQYVGMGKDLCEGFHEVREIFDQAGDALNIDIARLCFEGPRDALDLTPNTQAAVLTADVAFYRVFKSVIGVEPSILAGHSLGEFAALCAAGALDFSDAVRLVYARGEYQQDAVPPGQGCMAAIIGLPQQSVDEICRTVDRKHGVVEVANINCPGQFVISGATAAVEQAMATAREKGARMVVKLSISVPCHCSLLNAAAERLDRHLDSVAIGQCKIPVIPNFDPDLLHEKDTTRKLLIRQFASPVRWQETIERMSRMGVQTIVEIGPKKTLTALIKRIDRDIKILNIEDKASLEATANFFDGGEAA